ncbi:MAG: acyltransferase [Oscillospiraceae bacterium]|jgi:surface polysaccharide O-acyltransferase-like enzyme|nr:acyltransferase [Oscillospiraceae bacterium]
MRKHYLDHLRSIAILLLFPYHTFMIYNDWGERFYVNGEPLFLTSLFIKINAAWMMPLLFAVAGMSSAYALKKRSLAAYAKERVSKLLLPLIFGLLLLIPIQAYIAALFHKGSASYLNFFVDFSDLSGTGGGFTTGQLWFILYLFVFSIICLPLMALYNKHAKKALASKLPLPVLLLLGLLPTLAHPLLNISGKSIGENLCYFLAGYFILSNEPVLQRLDKHRFVLLGLSLVCLPASLYFNYAFFEWLAWLLILTILGLARHYLSFSGKVSGYLAKSSFGVYLFHQSWIIIAAFFVLKLTDKPALQIVLILLSSIILTYLTYELCRLIKPLRWMFGFKK